MPDPRYLIVPKSRMDDFRVLFSLGTQQILSIASALRSKEQLKSEESPLQIVAKAGDLPNAQAVAVMNVVVNVLQQRKRYSISDAALIKDLEAILSGEPSALAPDKRAALINLFSETDEDYLVHKADFLRTAFVAHLVESRTVCDVRPLFDRNREKIVGATLVTILGLTAHDEQHDERSFVVQVSRDQLRKLRECLDDTERKLTTMENAWKSVVDLF